MQSGPNFDRGTTRLPFTASTRYQPIQLTQAATPGDLIHTCGDREEEVWLWANNQSLGALGVSIEFGAAGAATTIAASVPIANRPADGLLVPGIPLERGGVLRAFSLTPSAIWIWGYVLVQEE